MKTTSTSPRVPAFRSLGLSLIAAAALGAAGCEGPAGDDEASAQTQDLRTAEAAKVPDAVPARTAGPSPITIVDNAVAPTVGREIQRMHPWVVSISGTGGLSCRGVLIHPSWVLTAAHCIGTIAGQVSYSRIDPVTGVESHDVRSFDVNAAHRGMYVHPGFVLDGGFGQPHNDIALIRLASPFAIDGNIQTAGLPHQPSNPGRVGSLAVNSHTGPLPAGYDELVKAPVLAANDCAAPAGFLCLQPPAASMCAGDSGSAFVMNLSGRATLVGIASNMSGGGDCLAAGGQVQVTDVYSYRDWILSTMGKNLEQVAGQVRLRWTGWSSSGTMSLLCERPGAPLVSVPMDVPGGEIGVDCDGTHAVRVFCQPQGSGASLVNFTLRTIAPDGSANVQAVPFLSLFTVYLADPSPSFQEFSCAVSTLNRAVITGQVAQAAL